jgi:hypothetical protein
VEIASEFVRAFAEFDADGARSYLSDEAVVFEWGSEEDFRMDIAWSRAIAYQQTMRGCGTSGDVAGAVIVVRCMFDMHALRSHELGLGPFAGNAWHITVGDGKIVSAVSDWNYEENGFSIQMWEPFWEWISETYPDDLNVMYGDDTDSSWTRSERSIALWEERTREYVFEVTGDDPTSGSA